MPALSSPTPLVSVIVPAYNVAHYLGEALASVRAQTYRHFEIIVVDDGSTDNTAEIAQSGGDVRYYRQENRGCGQARNTGIGMARGELLAFLDADDYWSPDKLAKQIEFYTALPSSERPILVYAHVKQFFSPEIEDACRAHIHFPPQGQPAHLPSALLISSADIAKIGLYESMLGDSIEWHLRAKDAGSQIYMLPDVMLYRRIHTTNMSLTLRHQKQQYVRSLKASLDRRRRQATQEKMEQTATV